jgi:hypothetical protein
VYKGLRSLEKLREDLILEGIKAYDDGGRGRERRERGLEELHEVPARTSSLCGAKRYRTDYSETRVPDRVGLTVAVIVCCTVRWCTEMLWLHCECAYMPTASAAYACTFGVSALQTRRAAGCPARAHACTQQ